VHPVLIEIGKFRIYSYGFMLALAFLVGIIFASRRAEREGLGREVIYDLSAVIVVLAVIGSRALYIITHAENYHSIIDVIALWQGGATYYGGLVLAIAGSWVFTRIKKISFLKVADIVSPSIGIGIFFTRIGCFLSGCCFGSPTSCSLGVVFPPNSPAGSIYTGLRIHPTQLYSSFYGLLIFVLLLLVERKKKFDGFVFAFLCVFYGIARFVIDFFRYYERSAFVGAGLTINQILSLGLIVVGITLLFYLKQRAESKEV